MHTRTRIGSAPPADTGLERLRGFARVAPQAAALASQIQTGIEGAYVPPPGFPQLEAPAVSAFQRQLEGEVTPREQAAFTRPALERFRSMTGQIADAGLATGRQFLPSDFATAAGGVPSQELASGLSEGLLGLERLRGERQAGALRTLRGFMPQVTAGREAFGGLIGEGARGAEDMSGVPAGVDPAAWRTNLYNIRTGPQRAGYPTGGYQPYA